jgi:hypothetical protein
MFVVHVVQGEHEVSVQFDMKLFNVLHLYIINSIQFFIISVLHQQPEGQLQMQHKGRQNNKYNKITTIRL